MPPIANTRALASQETLYARARSLAASLAFVRASFRSCSVDVPGAGDDIGQLRKELAFDLLTHQAEGLLSQPCLDAAAHAALAARSPRSLPTAPELSEPT